MKLSYTTFFALGLSAAVAVPYAEEVAQIKQGIKQMSSKTDTLKTMKQLVSKSFNKILNEAEEQQRKLRYEDGTVDFDDELDDTFKPLVAFMGCILATTPLEYQTSYSYNFMDDTALVAEFNAQGFTTSSTCLDYYTSSVALGCNILNDDDDQVDDDVDDDDDDWTDYCEAPFWNQIPDTMTECLGDIDDDNTDQCQTLVMGYSVCQLTCISDALGCDESICESTDDMTNSDNTTNAMDSATPATQATLYAVALSTAAVVLAGLA